MVASVSYERTRPASGTHSTPTRLACRRWRPASTRCGARQGSPRRDQSGLTRHATGPSALASALRFVEPVPASASPFVGAIVATGKSDTITAMEGVEPDRLPRCTWLVRVGTDARLLEIDVHATLRGQAAAARMRSPVGLLSSSQLNGEALALTHHTLHPPTRGVTWCTLITWG